MGFVVFGTIVASWVWWQYIF